MTERIEAVMNQTENKEFNLLSYVCFFFLFFWYFDDNRNYDIKGIYSDVNVCDDYNSATDVCSCLCLYMCMLVRVHVWYM